MITGELKNKIDSLYSSQRLDERPFSFARITIYR